ncbi:MAG: TonB family protein [Polyangiaceae bacterium]
MPTLTHTRRLSRRQPWLWLAILSTLLPSLARAEGSPGDAAPPAAPRPAVTPPVVIQHVDAVYPPSALAAREHADVILTVTVDADGHVSKVDVFESGGADLDEAAVVAARGWTFVPAMRGAQPVASRIHIPFHFAPPAPPPEVVEPSAAATTEVPVHQAVPSTPVAPARATPAPIEVLVTGHALAPSRGPSDYKIPMAALTDVPHAGAADLLTLAPGVLVTNEGGEGHADSLIVRGFDAGEGEDMELSVGGVPINDPGNFHGNGYADTHFIIPEVVTSLRVLEGPFDPRQGNFAVAGSADYELGLAQRGLTAKQTFGSYNSRRTLLAWGPEDQNAHTFAAMDYARSDGYGQNRGYQKGSALAQYEGNLGAHGTWRVTGQAYAVVAQAAGVIREDDYEAGRVGFYDSYDRHQGQDSTRYSLSADLLSNAGSMTLAQQFFVVDRSTRIREDFTGYVSDAGDPEPRGSMADLSVKEQSIGARGSAHTRGQALGQTQDLELGYFARADSVNNVQRLVARDTQAPYATDASLSGTLTDLALYADASLKPLSWLTLRGGLREELFTYLVEDGCPSLTDCNAQPTPTGNPRTSLASSALLPRVSVLLGTFSGVTFAGSYGQGVRSLAIDEVGAPGAGLAKISSYEGGVSYAKATSAGALSLSSVFFGTQVTQDQVFDPTVGRTVSTGATTRAGWTGTARFVGRFLDSSLNASAGRGTVNATHEPIPYVPHVIVRSESAVFGTLPVKLEGHPLRASLGPQLSYVGERSLPYNQTSAPYFLVSAALKVHWRSLELALTGTNLLDTKYRSSEFTFLSDFHTQTPSPRTPSRVFTAGAPRLLFVSVGGTLGG